MLRKRAPVTAEEEGLEHEEKVRFMREREQERSTMPPVPDERVIVSKVEDTAEKELTLEDARMSGTDEVLSAVNDRFVISRDPLFTIISGVESDSCPDDPANERV